MQRGADSHDHTSHTLGAAENRAIWLLLCSAFVVILNETLMGVALPPLMDDLGISAATGQWLTTVFLLTMSIVIPITGRLIQQFKTRQLYLAAMSLFLAGTLLSAFAPGFFLLLIGRVIQAMGTAVMMPLLMTTVVTLVPRARRGAIMGRISIVMSVAPALGPTVSGLILQYLDWRWIFITMLPFVIAAIAVGALWLPNVGEQRKRKIDALSVALSAGGFGGIVYALSALGEAESQLISPVIPLMIGIVLIALLILRQRSLQAEDRALLDLRVFRAPSYRIATGVLAISMMALFGALIVLPIAMQRVLDIDTLGTGLALLPGGLIMGLLGPVVGNLVDRIGVKRVLIPGLTVVLAGVILLSLLHPGVTIWSVIGAHFVLSVGLAGTFTPLFTAAFESVPTELASHGSAILSTLQQVAGAAGTAIFITVMSLVALRVSPSAPESAAALASGSSAAFVGGIVIVSLALILALFLKPEPTARENRS